MNTEQEELTELIHACLDGRATEEQASQLNARLRTDAAARDLYLQLADTHSCLAVDESLWVEPNAIAGSPDFQIQPARQQWFTWRPLAAAAAGLVIGLFSATAVWAIVSGKTVRERELALVDGGFEQSAPEFPLRVPRKFGEWAGDPVQVVAESGGIRPRSGQRMVRFMASAMQPELRAANNASDLWQVMPLPGSGERLLRVRAWFNAVKPAAFSLGAVAGAGGPESAAKLWEARGKDDPQVLAASVKSVRVDALDHSWKMAELLLQVPDNARVLVIDVAAHRIAGEQTNDGFAGQFVDDVSVSLLSETPLP